MDCADVDVIHVANAFGELFAAQGHLGAMPATVCEALGGVPASRHEAPCASGSAATVAAMDDARFLWPSMFAQVADEYDRRYGLDDTHLHAIAQLNFVLVNDKYLRDHPGPRPIGRIAGWGHRTVDAGDYQVDDATTFATLNFGGSTATTVSFVVAAANGS